MKKTFRPTLFTLALLAGVGLLLTSAAPAAACGGCYWICDGFGCYYVCNASVTQVAPNTVVLAIENYETEEMDGGSCTAALATGVSSVEGVESIELLESASLDPIAGYRFESLAGPADDLTAITAQEAQLDVAPHEWARFMSPVYEPVAGGQVTTLLFQIELAPGTNVPAFAQELHREGVLVTGAATPDGRLDTSHAGHHMVLPLRDLRLDLRFGRLAPEGPRDGSRPGQK